MGDEIGFGVDERTAVPSQKEINSTIGKISAPHIKKHILKSLFFWLPLTILIIAGGAFAYTQFVGESGGMTDGVIGTKSISSKLTGFFVDDYNQLPPTEKFAIKISGAKIDLSSEEQELQTSMTSKCSQEKTTVKENAETEQKAVCQERINKLMLELDSIQTKYDNCQDSLSE